MANIAITSRCNLNCPYCFTQEVYRNESNEFGHMTLPIFIKALEFVTKSDIKQIRLLGGEPTLHPQFNDILDLALQTGRPVRVFSNGLMPQSALEYLSRLPEDRITLVLNINTSDGGQLSSKLKAVLSRLNRIIMPGLNIYHKDIQPESLLHLIQTYDLKRRVRLGLAHPCVGYDNRYLPPKDYVKVGRNILDFARIAMQQSVKINLDCGFVPCMFGGVDLPSYGLDRELGLHCEPIPDILPDGSLVACYPLSGLHKTHLNDINKAEGLRNQFKKQLSVYDTIGIFKTCSICDYKRNGYCTGGCVAHKIRRLI